MTTIKKTAIAFLLVVASILSILILTSTFPEGSRIFREKIIGYYYHLRGDSQNGQIADEAPSLKPKGGVTGKKNGANYTFSENDIEKAKRILLDKGAQQNVENIKLANLKNHYSPQQDESDNFTYVYEVELLSGSRVIADRVSKKGSTLTYANNKGLQVSIDEKQVKSVRKFKIKGISKNSKQ